MESDISSSSSTLTRRFIFNALKKRSFSGTEHQKDLDLIIPYVEAGATWWQESFAGSDSLELEAVRTHIRQGPPKLDLKERL